MHSSLRLLALFVLSGASAAQQLDNIVISTGTEGGIPIAVVPFDIASLADASTIDTDVAEIIASNLARTGEFDPLAREDLIDAPSRREDVNFPLLRAMNTDLVVVGRMVDGERGQTVEFELLDVAKDSRLLNLAVPTRAGELRAVAHYISDLIYEKIMGVKGAFATKIAYITAVGTGGKITYSLMIADADGYKPQTVVRSNEPLLSPAWAPDARQIAYVSFESGNSSIWIQDIYTGQRRAVATFKGINGAPAFSPDGSKLALTLSRSGNPEINIMDLATSQFTQLTSHWSIDTEPQWASDGQSVYFTSDRSGKPQIYRVGASGGEAERLTFQGDYNARVSVSFDGKRLATTLGERNDYRIAITNLDTRRTEIVSSGPLDESPTFAPNGKMLLYAAKVGGRGVLFAVSANARVRQQLTVANGDVREPSWSPFLRR